MLTCIRYNVHRAIGESNPKRRVIVVEGFFDCMKVTEARFPCVAMMSSAMSRKKYYSSGISAWRASSSMVTELVSKASLECLTPTWKQDVGLGSGAPRGETARYVRLVKPAVLIGKSQRSPAC